MIISLFLLSLIALILEGLVAAEKITFSPILSDLSSIAVEVIRYLVLLVFSAVTAGALIVMILNRRLFINFLKGLIGGPRDAGNQSMLRQVLTWAVGFGVMFVTMWFFAGGGIGGLSFTISEDGQSPIVDGEVPSPTPLSVPQEPPQIPTLFLVPSILFIVVVFVCGVLFIQALRETREENMNVPPPLEDKLLQEEALTVVGEAISEIKTREDGLDFRAAIIRCYERLCELLAQYNCQIQKHETVQEFRINASKLLNIPDEPLSMLTNLFEEARYSRHEVGEAKRNEALKCLEEIKSHLAGSRP
ncbi:MAG: DUF4129 domain-containing protein [Nitrososphaerota archaeon]|nr:DUF4129 domain-containing protein [Nitrososphaerota archaeon]